MSNSKHTKGPWTALEISSLKKDGDVTYLLCNETPHAHGTLYGVKRGDVDLISAAPEMLEALKSALLEMKSKQGSPVKKKVMEAIAKAEGEE